VARALPETTCWCSALAESCLARQEGDGNYRYETVLFLVATGPAQV